MSVGVIERESRAAPAQAAPAGDLAAALEHGRRLLGRDPGLALEQAQEILRILPRSGEAYHLQGRAQAALGRSRAAHASLAEAVRLAPDQPRAWLALAQACAALGDPPGAEAAYLRHVETGVCDPELMAAATALADNRLDQAEARLRTRLKAEPTDIAAIRMLAEVAARLGRYSDAEALLERALELAPAFVAARHNYAQALYRQGRGEATLAEAARLLAADPAHPGYLMLEAGARALVGDYGRSVELYEALLARHDGQPKLWLSYGHTLKTLGRRDDCVAAYRRCTTLAPAMGEAWWSLANVKTVRFDAAERAALAAWVARDELPEEDRLHFAYAFGKALEDEGDFDAAFDRYAAGAALQKRRLGYDAAETSAQAARVRQTFTAGLLAQMAGQGCPDAAPIFIVGLPRSGSTLIEQILASHSQVEGTMELAEMSAVARRAGAQLGGHAAYPTEVGRLSAQDLVALGQGYIDNTRIHRRSGRPLFIDKMPNNWLHVGLIRLVLPNARIIDARRHPLGACFSAFKQHFARGQAFSYDLADLGRYYADYVGLMAHMDREAPGAVHRVIYEDLVQDTEGEVRRLLDHCGLAFEPACLRFHETERAVRTASAEQVRRTIYREGLDHWKNFEGRLDPLKAALGPVLKGWRAASA